MGGFPKTVDTVPADRWLISDDIREHSRLESDVCDSLQKSENGPRQAALQAGETPRTGAQLARFDTDEPAVPRHVRPEVQEAAAASATGFRSDS